MPNIKIYNYLYAVDHNNNNDGDSDLSVLNTTSLSIEIRITEDDLLNNYLKSKAQSSAMLNPLQNNDSETPVEVLIESFNNLEILPAYTNMFKFWDTKDEKFSRVAKIVLAALVTQVSVERIFSMLKRILTDKSSNIDEDLLEDTLILVMNNILEEKQK